MHNAKWRCASPLRLWAKIAAIVWGAQVSIIYKGMKRRPVVLRFRFSSKCHTIVHCRQKKNHSNLFWEYPSHLLWSDLRRLWQRKESYVTEFELRIKVTVGSMLGLCRLEETVLLMGLWRTLILKWNFMCCLNSILGTKKHHNADPAKWKCCENITLPSSS